MRRNHGITQRGSLSAALRYSTQLGMQVEWDCAFQAFQMLIDNAATGAIYPIGRHAPVLEMAGQSLASPGTGGTFWLAIGWEYVGLCPGPPLIWRDLPGNLYVRYTNLKSPSRPRAMNFS